jgi:hypothetical protein
MTLSRSHSQTKPASLNWAQKPNQEQKQNPVLKLDKKLRELGQKIPEKFFYHLLRASQIYF